jgi:hypothetical protein
MIYKFCPTISYIMLKEITPIQKKDEFKFPAGLNTESTYIILKLDMQQRFNPIAIYQEAITTIQIFISLLCYPQFNTYV